ncbi:ribosome biogenesis ATPase [Schizosaccharomyces octosporus yFS286]|uniref:Ribosome biogenesis ATPase n=1 Tax=Schizosaccharomyces octosporus (strain yFS286) TaxID=483514 RepID=S9PZ82_SCHOY|nr:ribosome biogenesis ATPase [Schizosaccharomyces octosporus yFS286]EPX74386.1 ribosome biogenesis ATPase [Schizosaccharomyces octosporus yFS286]
MSAAPKSSSKLRREAKQAERLAAKGQAPKSKSSKNGKDKEVDGVTTDLSQLSTSDPIFERSASGVLVSQPMSRDIKIDSYTLSFHGRLLIENAVVELNHGQRYGLLGDNGSGKSTFLESLAARDVEIPEHIDVYLLNAEAEPTDINAVEYIIKSAKEKVQKLELEIEELSTADDVDDVLLETKYEELDDMDPSTFEAKAAMILNGLGFTQEMMKKPTKDMSGGWRMRVSLSRALFIKPSLLLLDEPTNHLDLEAVVWLESYLAKYDKCLVVTSHSQDFLNNVCTNIIDLNTKKQLIYYGGNFDIYMRTKEENETNQMKAYLKQQEEIAHIKKFIAGAGTYANLVRQAKSKQKIIDKMEAAGLIEKPEPPRSFSFEFEEVRKLPPPIIAFNDVAFSYDGNIDHSLYRDLSFGIDMDSRVAIVGKNGTGKSTLLNLITGMLIPIEGNVSRYSGLKLAKYSQHSADQLPYEKSPLEYVSETYKSKFPNRELQQWRSVLGKFGLSGQHQTSEIRTLSDGLKSRVVFAALALEEPHILLLDEPTNHLDITSIDALAGAINRWSGGVVLVSHDFRLIGQVSNELWEVKDKKIVKLDCNIEEYKKQMAIEVQSHDTTAKVKHLV